MSAVVKILFVVVNEADTWEDGPLYKAILQRLQRLDIAGATAHVGVMGFGRHHRMHHKGLFGISDDRPITILAVDGEAKIRTAAAEVRTMLQDGLVLLIDGEAIGDAVRSAERPA